MSDGKVKVRDQDGKEFMLPSAQLQKAQQQGYELVDDAAEGMQQQAAGPSPMDTLPRAIGQGASFGGWDEMVGMGGALAGNDVLRAAGRGMAAPLSDEDAQAALTREEREQMAVHRATNPKTAMIGEALGAAAQAAPAAIAAGAASPMALLGEGALLGGMWGMGESDPDPTATMTEQAATRAGGGALAAAAGGPINALIPGASGKAADVIEGIADTAGRAASRRRLGAMGAQRGDIKKLVKGKGMDKAEAMGRRAENLGISKADWESNLEAARPAAERAASRLASLRGQVRQGVSLDAVADDLIRQADELQKVGSAEANKQAERLLAEGEALLSRGTTATYDEALKLRQYHDSRVWKNNAARDSDGAQMHRDIAMRLRQAMDDAASAEDPVIADSIRDASADYEVAKFAIDMGEQRLAGEAGNWPVSAPASLSGAVGMASGSPVSGALATGATEAVKRYGQSGAANVLRGVESAGHQIARPMTPAAGAAASAVRRGAAVETAQSISPADRVREAVMANPQEFGAHGHQLAMAAESDDPKAFPVAYTLAQQNPEFQRKLREMEEAERQRREEGDE